MVRTVRIEFIRCLVFCSYLLIPYIHILVGSSAYGDQIMLQFIVQRQPQITLENLKEVIQLAEIQNILMFLINC